MEILYDEKGSFKLKDHQTAHKRILEIQEVDIAVGPLAMFPSRLSVVDYSYAYGFDSYYILIPSPQVQPNFAAPWKPFSLTVSRPDQTF